MMEKYIQSILHAFQIPLQNQILVFAILLLIILLAPILLRRFNIPGIIILIISGIIIGPHGFGIIERTSAIDLFSTIGLLYIMFIAGLELDFNEFRATKRKSLIFGFLTFSVPLLIGIVVCHNLLMFNYETSVLTSCMFASHTLIAYPIVSKFGVSKNQAVAVTVGGTILTDSAVLILLAIVIGEHNGSLDYSFWLKILISLVVFILVMFKFVPFLSKWFFYHLESEKHSHYIYVLSILFFSAFLAEICGFEPIIGAFMAGLALNRLIPSSSALMNRIEFIGNSLFIPFFLIGVGMLVDISTILKGPHALIIAGVLLVVALSGKWLAAFFSQKIFKYSSLQRKLMFGLSSSHAAATLAVVLVGFKAGILNDDILNGTIILILFACIVASFVTQYAAKQLALKETHLSNFENNDVQEKIILPISSEIQFERFLDFALFIKDRKSITPISVVTVLPNNKDADLEIVTNRTKLEQYVKQGSASEIYVDIDATLDFNVSGGIVRMVKEKMANIIIMGWPRQIGLIDMLIGEKAGNVVNNTDKTVFMCQLSNPFFVHKRIVMVAPVYFEKEPGFSIWIKKIGKLAQELSLPIMFFCPLESQKFFYSYIKRIRLNLSVIYRNFNDWDQFFAHSENIDADDLIVAISARKDSPSYINLLDTIPAKLDKYFKTNNKIVVYPQQSKDNNLLAKGDL